MNDLRKTCHLHRSTSGGGVHPTLSPTFHFLVFVPEWRRVLSRGYNYWGTTESRNQSCGEGEYAEGIYYYVYQPEDPGTFSFYLMELELLCTSAPLGERIDRGVL